MGKYELDLVDFILKNTYYLRKDRAYNIKVRPKDWPVHGEEEEWVKSLNFALYTHLTIKYKEHGSMANLCLAVNR